MNALLASGIPYEIAGLIYFLFYLAMSRPRAAAAFSRRSKVLTLLAAIALVGAAVLHYGAQPLGIAIMLALVVVSLVSTYLDRRAG
ncbi:MAG TPA: hypothetical protein VMD91_09860 [Candidatus Sulfotelmatobacter sp.]|nr:hypothetical protein [Candidatus Sulfotelmatobacter sp.]